MNTLKNLKTLLWCTSSLSCIILFMVMSGCKPEIDCDSEPIIDVASIPDQFAPLVTNPPGGYNIEYLKPTVQRFVPTLHALDFVSLTIEDAGCSGVGSAGGDLLVRIRKSSITGEIVGVSNAEHFDNCFSGVKEFQFSSYVTLIPGQSYFIEPVYVSGNTSLVWISSDLNPYPQGAFFLEGIELLNADMVFREGIYNSLPKSKCDCKDRLKYVIGPTGLPFKNASECVRFIDQQLH